MAPSSPPRRITEALTTLSSSTSPGYLPVKQFQKKENPDIIPPRAVPKKHHDFWTAQPLSPEEDLEKKLLLESIAWPETPPLPTPLSLMETSCPAKSSFTILPQSGDGQWHVGDKLKVLIKMYDFQGHPKKSGGDVLFARLHNLTLGAGVVGKVEDHLNGTYSAVFSLLWEGSAWVEVTLVHPSEAVTVLRRWTSEQPIRVYHKSLFRSGSVSETTICTIFLRSTDQPLCNYTDLHTGDPWFCFKPKNLTCDTRINHSNRQVIQYLKANEEKLFQLGVNMKVSIPASGPASVTVLPRQQGQVVVNSNNVESGPSGYYYHGAWQTLTGTKVQQFNTPSAITQCLKGKVVHLQGDSTIRQWFEYFSGALPGLKEFDLHSQKKIGPLMTVDIPNNILVTYRCHGPPIGFPDVPISELRYIANELDNVVGGTDTVVIFGIWAHLAIFPVEVYIRRLQTIRRAVVRLLNRSPGTVVIIRTANPKALMLERTLTNNEWYTLQNDKVLRAIFKGLNVYLLDAWEMVLAHHLPHDIHPPPPIIKNMINVILSYICPMKGG
ncbi:NXPE family member 3-like [Acanthochromis polyacanthus]|uniref:NXPE family member 3-like n=1 Tax=Acanthochromis polyacanthus TaxID=80966 RepID=UPI00223481D7|nr:NXPE family member 3-like [Acanthochromis polyacanthus]